MSFFKKAIATASIATTLVQSTLTPADVDRTYKNHVDVERRKIEQQNDQDRKADARNNQPQPTLVVKK
jgi:hypothetical protein